MDKDLIINTTVAGIGTSVTCLIGGWDKIIQILAILMIADYLTGMSKGILNKELASYIGFKGLLKKGAIFFVILLAYQIDLISNPESPIFRTMAIYFYIGNEGISLLENLAVLNVPLPLFLIDVLKNIKDKNNKISKEG